MTSGYFILAAVRKTPDATSSEVAKVVGCSKSTADIAMRNFAKDGQLTRRMATRDVLSPRGDGRTLRTVKVFVYRMAEAA